jgi:hypothetical protein
MTETETSVRTHPDDDSDVQVPELPDEDHGDAHEPDEDPRDEARREAIKYRRKLRAAEQANDELRADNERLRQQIVEHETRAGDSAWRRAFAAAAVELAAHQAGARRPAIVSKLVSLDGMAELDTIEAIKAAAEAKVTETLQDAPELKGATGNLVTQGARSSPRPAGPQKPDDWIRQQARR